MSGRVEQLLSGEIAAWGFLEWSPKQRERLASVLAERDRQIRMGTRTNAVNHETRLAHVLGQRVRRGREKEQRA